MFVVITGKPRSGKSAYAIDYMLKNKENYHNIYSDINGLKKHDNIKLLNFKSIHSIITKCMNIYIAVTSPPTLYLLHTAY